MQSSSAFRGCFVGDELRDILMALDDALDEKSWDPEGKDDAWEKTASSSSVAATADRREARGVRLDCGLATAFNRRLLGPS